MHKIRSSCLRAKKKLDIQIPLHASCSSVPSFIWIGPPNTTVYQSIWRTRACFTSVSTARITFTYKKKSLLKYTFGNFYSFQRILPFYYVKLLVGVKKILADVFIFVPTVMWFLHFPVPVTPIQVRGDCGNYNKDFILTEKLLLLCTGKIEHRVCGLPRENWKISIFLK